MILAALALMQSAAPAAAQNLPSTADEIVITAQRSGVPVWRASRGGGTLVLVGTIRDIAQGTKWSSAAVEAAVGQSGRVMFPEMTGITGSPFAAIGWLAKWKRQARLPSNQSLSMLLSAQDRQRLAALQQRGLAPRDWDRFHPLHLAFKLQEGLRKRTGIAPSANVAINRAIKRHKVVRVPIARASGGAFVNELFSSQPQSHVPCLAATITLVEAGSAELRRRSQAWAARRVPEAIASPVEAVEDRCWPATSAVGPRTGLHSTARQELQRSGTTLAVVDLASLARPGGLLDKLQAEGVTIEGPRWR